MYNINNINKYFFYGSIGGFGFSYLYLIMKNNQSKLLYSGNFIKYYGELINNGLYFGILFGLLRANIGQS